MGCHLERRCCRHPTRHGYGWSDGRWINLLAWDPPLSPHSLVQHTTSQAVVSWYHPVGTSCCPYLWTGGQHSGSCRCVSITRSGNLNICGTSLPFCSSVPAPPALHLCLSSSDLSSLPSLSLPVSKFLWFSVSPSLSLSPPKLYVSSPSSGVSASCLSSSPHLQACPQRQPPGPIPQLSRPWAAGDSGSVTSEDPRAPSMTT